MSIDQLLAGFSSLDVETSNEPYHMLSFQFPAVELLPEGAKLHLEPPRFAAQRDRPPQNTAILGMLDAGFYTMVPTASRPQPSEGQREHQGLLDAVVGLSDFPGTSLLRISTHAYDKKDPTEILCRFRLESNTKSDFKTSKDFELDSVEMSGLLEAALEHRWVRLVEHLLNRESDRAYLHVLSNMGLSDPWLVVDQMELEQWAHDKKCNVVEAFQQSFIHLQTENNINGGELVELGTKCGHSLTIDRAAFERVAVEDCMSARCQRCGKTIINDFTRAEVKASQDSRHVAEFKCKNELWVRLDHKIDGGDFSFEADEIFVALEMSLESLTPPALACPPGFSFGAYPATKAVLETFRGIFEDSAEILDVSGNELADQLFRVAQDVKMGSSNTLLHEVVRRPRYAQEMKWWLRRAVNLAIASCKWRVEDIEQEDSILKAIGELTLEGTSVESIGIMFNKLGL